MIHVNMLTISYYVYLSEKCQEYELAGQRIIVIAYIIFANTNIFANLIRLCSGSHMPP